VPVDRGQRDALLLETVKLAVELGADVNVASTDGRTALDSARAQKQAAIVELLESRGAIGKPATQGSPAGTKSTP
jgi:ankyrin repeat protein